MISFLKVLFYLTEKEERSSIHWLTPPDEVAWSEVEQLGLGLAPIWVSVLQTTALPALPQCQPLKRTLWGTFFFFKLSTFPFLHWWDINIQLHQGTLLNYTYIYKTYIIYIFQSLPSDFASSCVYMTLSSLNNLNFLWQLTLRSLFVVLWGFNMVYLVVDFYLFFTQCFF